MVDALFLFGIVQPAVFNHIASFIKDPTSDSIVRKTTRCNVSSNHRLYGSKRMLKTSTTSTVSAYVSLQLKIGKFKPPVN